VKTDRLLEEIKSRTDIVDFISSYVQLKKSGQNWKGICPFHSEKTPSFMVSPSKQIFHCFGCSAGGDVITFLMKYENIAFQEALQLLAKKAGVVMPSDGRDGKSVRKYEKIRDLLSEASTYYAKKLKESKKAMEYLNGRGITSESIVRFGVGYAPEGWHNLIRHLRGLGCDDAMVKDAGLAVRGERGLYDMFRHRIMFPITNMSGGVIAFGGRAMEDSTAKYINSPETAVFKKSETLFGLSHAKEAIRKEDSVIIVEGYMDVIVCHQYGFRNAIAPLGTALTPGHIQKLRTVSGRAVLVFDGDAAGRAAAKRALSLICQNNYSAKVLVLPEDEDPDSYLRRHGAGPFASLLSTARTPVDFLFSIATGGTLETVRETLTLISGLDDVLAADEMLVELSQKAGLHETAIREEFRKVRSKSNRGGSRIAAVQFCSSYSEEYLLLSAVIAFPEKMEYVLSRITLDDLRDRTVVSLFRKLVTLGETEGPGRLLDVAEEEERKLVTRLSVDPGFDPDQIDRNIEDCLRRMAKRKLDERIRRAQNSGDLALINSLLLEKKRFTEGIGL
jgi:DNA primase